MIDPYVQQTQASMYMSPWQGFTSQPGMMSGGPQGYTDPGSISNMQSQYGAAQSGVSSSVYGAMYDNPFTTSFAMQRSNLLARPRGAQYAAFQAHADNISMGTGAAMTSAAMDIGGGLAGGSIGAAVGQMLIPIPGVGAVLGGLAGGYVGSAIGGVAASGYANRAGRQGEVHRSLMGLANSSSPYGGGFGYSTQDAKKVYQGMEDQAIEDPYFGIGDISKILDEGIKMGAVSGSSSTGDIKSKLKGLKETAKSLVEIFGDSDISEIMDTLRRLNGTGMSNAQAVEASRSIGMAARSMGMKESDMFNMVMQKGEAESGLGRGTSHTIMTNSVDATLAFEYNADLQKNFNGKDDFRKKLAEYDTMYSKVMTGDSGVFQMARKNITTESGMMVLAEGQAMHDVGGREAFQELSRSERAAARSAAMEKVQGRVDNGDSLMGMATAFKREGNIDLTTIQAFLDSNQVAMDDFSQGISADYKQGKGYKQWTAKNKARMFDELTSNEASLAQVTKKSSFYDINKVIEEIGGSKVTQATEKTKLGEQMSALRTAGSIDRQYQAKLTELSSAFGKMIEGLVEKVKSSSADRISTATPGSSKQLDMIMEIASTKDAVRALKTSTMGTDTASMFTTGDRSSSIFNGLRWAADVNADALEGVGNKAGLNGGRIGSTHEAHEISNMIKSKSYSKEKTAASMAKTVDLFNDLNTREISRDEFHKNLSDTGSSSEKDILKFSNSNIMEQIRSGTIKDTQKMSLKASMENKSLIDLGLETHYGMSVLVDDSQSGWLSGVTETYRETKDYWSDYLFGDGNESKKKVRAEKEGGISTAAKIGFLASMPLRITAVGQDTMISEFDTGSKDQDIIPVAKWLGKTRDAVGTGIGDAARYAWGWTKGSFDTGEKGDKRIADMQTIAHTSRMSTHRTIEVSEAEANVNYSMLKNRIHEYGLFEGVANYTQESGITDGMSEGGQKKLTQALRYGQGNRALTKSKIQKEAMQSQSIMSSGTDIQSAMAVFGVEMHGGVNVQQIDQFTEGLRKGEGTDYLLQQGIVTTKEEAVKYQEALAGNLDAHKEEIAVASQAPFYMASKMFYDTISGKAGKVSKKMKNDSEFGGATIEFLALSEEDRAKTFKAAQKMSETRNHEKYGELRAQQQLSGDSATYADLSNNQFSIARKLAESKDIKDMDVEKFSSMGMREKALLEAVDLARTVTGKTLTSKDSQAHALGMMELLRGNEKEGFRAMSGDEAKEAYTKAVGKEEENRTLGDKILVAAGKNMKARGDSVGENMSGVDLVQELSTAGGLGMSQDTLARNMNSGKASEDKSVNLLESINTRMGELVRAANAKAGIKSEKIINNNNDTNSLVMTADRRVENKAPGSIKEADVVPGYANARKVSMMPESLKILNSKGDLPAGSLGENQMIAKKSANLNGLKQTTVDMLKDASKTFSDNDKVMVITQGTDSSGKTKNKRIEDAKHMSGHAVNLGINQFKDAKEAGMFAKELFKNINKGKDRDKQFNVAYEKDHIHIEKAGKGGGEYTVGGGGKGFQDFGTGRTSSDLKKVEFSDMKMIEESQRKTMKTFLDYNEGKITEKEFRKELSNSGFSQKDIQETINEFARSNDPDKIRTVKVNDATKTVTKTPNETPAKRQVSVDDTTTSTETLREKVRPVDAETSAQARVVTTKKKEAQDTEAIDSVLNDFNKGTLTEKQFNKRLEAILFPKDNTQKTSGKPQSINSSSVTKADNRPEHKGRPKVKSIAPPLLKQESVEGAKGASHDKFNAIVAEIESEQGDRKKEKIELAKASAARKEKIVNDRTDANKKIMAFIKKNAGIGTKKRGDNSKYRNTSARGSTVIYQGKHTLGAHNDPAKSRVIKKKGGHNDPAKKKKGDHNASGDYHEAIHGGKREIKDTKKIFTAPLEDGTTLMTRGVPDKILGVSTKGMTEKEARKLSSLAKKMKPLMDETGEDGERAKEEYRKKASEIGRTRGKGYSGADLDGPSSTPKSNSKHSSIFDHKLGGSRAADISSKQADSKNTHKDQKRDLAAQTNTLLERIAAASEATRDALSNSAPPIKSA